MSSHAEMRALRQAERKAELDVARKRRRLRSKFAREKARSLALLARASHDVDYIQDPSTGRFQGSHGHGGTDGGGKDSGKVKVDPDAQSGSKYKKSTSPYAKDPKSASSLYRIDTTATVDSLIDKNQSENKNTRKYIDEANAKIKAIGGRQTIDPVSKGGYKLPDGSWTPKQQAVHADITRTLASPEMIERARPKPGEQKTMYVLGGRGGSGKGWITENKDGPLYGNPALVLNSDHVKEQHPDWQGWNASTLHEESSEVGKAMEAMAIKEGVNTILDITMASKSSTEKRIKAFKDAGYRIEGYYMYAPPEKAASQAIGRFVRGTDAEIKKGSDKMGRYVLPEIPLTSTENEHNFDRSKRDFAYWEIYDNGGSSFAPKLHASGGTKR